MRTKLTLSKLNLFIVAAAVLLVVGRSLARAAPMPATGALEPQP